MDGSFTLCLTNYDQYYQYYGIICFVFLVQSICDITNGMRGIFEPLLFGL